MTDTIFKIIQTLTNGFKVYKESRKNLYENFLQPAMADFDRVHKNYLNSYIKYSRLLSESKEPYNKNHPVFKMLKEDALFSIHIRSKLYSFYDYTNDQTLRRFVQSIRDYFNYSSESARFNNTLDYEMEKCSNCYRFDTYHGLMYIFENKEIPNKKTQALIQIKMAVENLQDNYIKVIDSYNELKIKLLK
jgi:hypothetical protein